MSEQTAKIESVRIEAVDLREGDRITQMGWISCLFPLVAFVSVEIQVSVLLKGGSVMTLPRGEVLTVERAA